MLWALVIAGWDIRRLRVPNLLLIVVAAPALATYAFFGQGLLQVSLRDALIGSTIGVLLTLPGYLIRQVGAGDVKYVALLGFLTGTSSILKILLASALVIGLLSLAALVEAKWRRRPARKIPAAFALSLAFVICLMGGMNGA